MAVGEDGAEQRWRQARRAVLDHLLALLADSPWGEALVLRGSMVMPAWVGAAAREPADLDWIVPRSTHVPIDRRDPYPYVAATETLQQWPEAADGAGAYEIWRFEEFDTRGLRAHVPPEGLHWIEDAEPEEHGPQETLRRLIERHPVAGPGIVLDPKSFRDDGTWRYDGDDDTPGVRVTVRWTAQGLPPGEATVDFARDERMPEAAVTTAVPRGDGTGTTLVRTAGPALSLAWKLLWLHADSADPATGHRARAKDLYDAVLLAETYADALAPTLLRRVLAREAGHPGTLDPDAVAVGPADWAALRAADPRITGTADQWLDRLRRALSGRHLMSDETELMARHVAGGKREPDAAVRPVRHDRPVRPRGKGEAPGRDPALP